MKVVIAGGTGFLGRPLGDALQRDGHEVVVLTRQEVAGGRGGIAYVRWSPGDDPWASSLDGAGAVVNLAGESIAARRWSTAQKERIRRSRLEATRGLVNALTTRPRPPAVFISGSAVGYYGPRGDDRLTENAEPGSDFLARVCIEWEEEARAAAGKSTRVVLLRTGVVLDRDGGALAKMLPPFKACVGGPLGSGRQYMPWIHRADWVDLVRWAIETPAATGPLNATAPEPVTNREFSQTLGRALRRPSWLPAPAFALRLALGEMATALLLSGQRAIPARATELGFRFRYPRLSEALGAIFPAR